MSDDADLAIQYSESQIELLDANCRTAVPFDDENSLIEEMGRRAKAKRRAARRVASEEVVSTAVESLSEETDCEIPSVRTAISPSKIPILQKGFVAQKSPEHKATQFDGSKIPILTKPKAQLIYLEPNSALAYSTASTLDEPPSFTPSSRSFTHHTVVTDMDPATIPANLTPLPKCDDPSEYWPSSEEEEKREHVHVVAEANGLEMKLDMTAMLKGLDLEMVGLRFL